ncbi:MAG: alkaline phosphatase family protein, partial [Clostridia bacterium]|nr:alkaline phosphatase family protein [Clostridia bacterium]
PDFNHSIVNIASTVAKFLGKDVQHSTLPKLEKKLNVNYKNIVYIVIDGMGSHILERNLPNNSFLRNHIIDTVTSVFPSTTASATTSLTTALTPSEHGWFAWSVDFDGEVIELFRNRNFYTHEFTTDREFAQHHLPYEKIFDNTNCDREIYSCFSDKISTKIHAEHEVIYHSLGQMFKKLQKICQIPQKKFIYAYYEYLDSTMHGYGISARKSRRLLKIIERKIMRLAKKNPDTLFIITADHGQTDVTGFTYICDDTAIQTCLEHPISLDPRGASFKIKPNKKQDFIQAFKKYEQDFTLYETEDLIKKGVFGEFNLHPEYKKYLGDFIAVGRDTGKMLVFSHGDEYKGSRRLYKGMHTGMTPEEMFVPVIVINGEK